MLCRCCWTKSVFNHLSCIGFSKGSLPLKRSAFHPSPHAVYSLLHYCVAAYQNSISHSLPAAKTKTKEAVISTSNRTHTGLTLHPEQDSRAASNILDSLQTINSVLIIASLLIQASSVNSERVCLPHLLPFPHKNLHQLLCKQCVQIFSEERWQATDASSGDVIVFDSASNRAAGLWWEFKRKRCDFFR